ncbi:TOBE domain-containing protein [Kinneretia asaccharophila]|uniref:Molybdate transport system regulatory protein n=1 Tax=Roseateles asaccharophilus TaxID=582607 RepID=A0A4R6MZT4_9BURK|nr:TOBE domain-containing protein [Roseateles asaccharophilus]MDN3545540.1 TOBE domain-containing protein [Roseateles asaccharophilus]TDP07920.1 molybdate transport system regulatory protein [Roseateles asaccharophilus]
MSGRAKRPTKPEPAAGALSLEASLVLSLGGEKLGGELRLALLREIGALGSISQAAKAVGLSYKAAWDAVEQMNNVAGQPLLERSAGGRGGGSTRLTARGEQLVARHARLQALHQRFVQQLSAEGGELGQDFPLLRMLTMRTSARNQFLGRISACTRGAVNDELRLALPGGAELVAIISHESTEQLGLQVGAEAFALVQAGAVMIARPPTDGASQGAGLRLSARNQLRGTVAALRAGAVNAELLVDIGGGQTLAATITQTSLDELGLAEGDAVLALFKASSVILGSPG